MSRRRKKRENAGLPPSRGSLVGLISRPAVSDRRPGQLADRPLVGIDPFD